MKIVLLYLLVCTYVLSELLFRNFVLSETNGSLSWHILLSKIIKKGMQNLHTAFSVKIVDKNGMQLLQDNRK